MRCSSTAWFRNKILLYLLLPNAISIGCNIKDKLLYVCSKSSGIRHASRIVRISCRSVPFICKLLAHFLQSINVFMSAYVLIEN